MFLCPAPSAQIFTWVTLRKRQVFAIFVIPLLPLPEQEKLRELMEQSEAAGKEAHSLLERAKRAVEIAIEEGEAAGLDYLSRGVAV